MIKKMMLYMICIAAVVSCNSTKNGKSEENHPEYDAQGVVEALDATPTPYSEETPRPERTPEELYPEEEVLLGGFQDLPLDSDYVTRAFAFLKTYLAKEFPRYTLDDPFFAQGQVVAGYKVKLECTYLDGVEEKQLRAYILFGLDETLSVLKLEIPLEK